MDRWKGKRENRNVYNDGIFGTIKYGKRKNRAKQKRKVKCIGSIRKKEENGNLKFRFIKWAQK